jgi:hypothetical protein
VSIMQQRARARAAGTVGPHHQEGNVHRVPADQPDGPKRPELAGQGSAGKRTLAEPDSHPPARFPHPPTRCRSSPAPVDDTRTFASSMIWATSRDRSDNCG